MSISKLTNQDLIYVKLDFDNKNDLLTYLGNELYSEGYVTDEYIKGVLDREEKYPTGLPLGVINCAIPHSEMEYVVQPCITIASLMKPINFKNMENTQEDIPVELVFMLAIDSGHQQVQVLHDLMKLLQQKDLVEKLVNATDKESVFHILESIS